MSTIKKEAKDLRVGDVIVPEQRPGTGGRTWTVVELTPHGQSLICITYWDNAQRRVISDTVVQDHEAAVRVPEGVASATDIAVLVDAARDLLDAFPLVPVPSFPPAQPPMPGTVASKLNTGRRSAIEAVVERLSPNVAPTLDEALAVIRALATNGGASGTDKKAAERILTRARRAAAPLDGPGAAVRFGPGVAVAGGWAPTLGGGGGSGESIRAACGGGGGGSGA